MPCISEEDSHEQDRTGLEMSRDEQVLVTGFYRSVDFGVVPRSLMPERPGLFSYS